jgi:hypothetical protein
LCCKRLHGGARRVGLFQLDCSRQQGQARNDTIEIKTVRRCGARLGATVWRIATRGKR